MHPQAKIDYLRKELRKKDRPKFERDILSLIVTQVQQQLLQHHQKHKEHQQKWKEQQLQKEQRTSGDKQHKEYQQPHFVGKVYVC